MKRLKGSFRLVRPTCPECHSDEVRLVHSLGNWSRIAADTVAGLFFFPMLSYKWRCLNCQQEFRADNVMDR